MTVLPHMDFAESALRMQYRASSESQELQVDVDIASSVVISPADTSMLVFCRAISAGAGGGGVFAPELSRAEVIRGTVDGTNKGPHFSWTLRVTAVDPLLLRLLVEALAGAGFYHVPVVAVSIVGSLPLDQSDLSVTESDARNWLDRADAYPGAWPDEDFPIADRDVGEGATIRVQTVDAMSERTKQSLQGSIIDWYSMITDYVSSQGKPAVRNMQRSFPRIATTRREVTVYYQEFLHAPQPSTAMLRNMLTCFHRREQRLAAAEIGIKL